MLEKLLAMQAIILGIIEILLVSRLLNRVCKTMNFYIHLQCNY